MLMSSLLAVHSSRRISKLNRLSRVYQIWANYFAWSLPWHYGCSLKKKLRYICSSLLPASCQLYPRRILTAIFKTILVAWTLNVLSRFNLYTLCWRYVLSFKIIFEGIWDKIIKSDECVCVCTATALSHLPVLSDLDPFHKLLKGMSSWLLSIMIWRVGSINLVKDAIVIKKKWKGEEILI